jgi:hypothetical protein
LPGDTELVLEAHADIAVPGEMEGVRIRAARADGAFMYDRTEQLGVGVGKASLPMMMTMVPSGTRSEVIPGWVDGSPGGVVIVSRTVLTTFVPEASWLLRISLRHPRTEAFPDGGLLQAAAGRSGQQRGHV